MTDPLTILLEVQAQDTALDQLRHRLAALPERAEHDAAVAVDTGLAADQKTETEALEVLQRSQKRLDDEVATLGAKRKGFDDRLYGGTVTSPRELQDLQDEIASLGRRIDQLEEEELEIMEQVEPIEARLSALQAQRAEQAAVIEAVAARLTVAEAETAVAIDGAQASRDAVVAEVPADLLAEYERLRKGLGGVGIAKLVGAQCGGCHLALSAMEASRLKKLPAGEVAHCEECGRILVP